MGTCTTQNKRIVNGSGPARNKPQIGSLRGKVPLIFGPSRLGCGQRIIESCGQLLSKIRAASIAVANAGLINKASWNPGDNNETVPLAAVAEGDESPPTADDVTINCPLLLSVSTTSVPASKIHPVGLKFLSRRVLSDACIIDT
jgi:hypothetical protein